MGFSIRKITQKDEGILWQMLCYAASMEAADGAAMERVRSLPELKFYVEGWGREGDIGFMATFGAAELPVGAAWLRLANGECKGLGHATETIPELSIGIAPEFRGRGLGTELLTTLFAAVQDIYPEIVLNVRQVNPARNLYARLGFVEIGEVANYAGTKSVAMKLDLTQLQYEGAVEYANG